MRHPLRTTPTQIEEWGRDLFQWSNELDQTLTDLGYPNDPPTEANVEEPPPEDEREARRWKSHIPRTTRKQPRPPVEKQAIDPERESSPET